MDIGALPAFQTMDAEEREAFIRACEPASIAMGEKLLTRGQPARAVYLIGRGRLRVHVDDRELAVLSAPCTVGEMELLTEELCTATVTALEVCEGYCVDYDGLRRRLQDGELAAHKFVHAIGRVVATRLATMNERVIKLLVADTAEAVPWRSWRP